MSPLLYQYQNERVYVYTLLIYYNGNKEWEGWIILRCTNKSTHQRIVRREPEWQWSGIRDKDKEESTFEAPLISEFSAESQTDSEVVNPKRKEKQPLINKTPKFESDSEVVNPKRKTKLFLINETQEDDRFVIDKECDIVIE